MLSEPITQMRGSSELLAAMVGDIAASGWRELGAGRWRVLSLHKVATWLALTWCDGGL